jgi:hypothetical protein
MVQALFLPARIRRIVLPAIVIFLFLLQRAEGQQLITYPAPARVQYSQHNDDYTVRVRQPGGE